MEDRVLNADERRKFLKQIDRVFNAFRRKGIICRKNFLCCQSCGHASLSGLFPNRSYVFYHAQNADDLRNGEPYVYLKYHIEPDDMKYIIYVITTYDVEWNGDNDTCMKLTYKD